ncbi:NADH-ubiquinone oxidoreductase-F iron-sulfur binding region domain-containing protein [Micropruina sonneratiae]|uniref:NADH-ubiquinone oxidoreductase-F iron-sulfur binding region domain-containing protein n=1 Tax=Micropruina sonneratiae TaxID=2986940 RepID=UPI002227DCF0|nr:NADH-ubiquinone oxidoreductase-F iron-sulfur binding region domain-containing protein [Micropruina sp. KQZ13P-5]MCW3158200.1 hypothetical protein [Micropruina sp. KQZ13P-5]
MTDVITLLESAGLTGRGGAGFSTAVKVKAARDHGARLIVNACDGELGAAKDAWIVEHKLVELLEGVRLVAGEGEVRFAAHRGSRTAEVLAAAGLRVLAVPHRYVSSEESALIALAGGRPAKPMTKRTPFVFGGRDSQGRPVAATVVLNAETVWRVGQLQRYGAGWFRSFGTPAEPGPRLVAVGGAVQRPGVYETAAGVGLGELLGLAGGAVPGVRYVGVGGLGGVLLSVQEVALTRWDTPGMAARGGSLGPGVVTAWDPAECPLNVAGRLIGYGAGESAGKCGPCMFGLPRLAQDWDELVRRPTMAGRDAFEHRLALLAGRGACHHPDGVVRFTRSALHTLAPEFAAHAAGRCERRVADAAHA